MKQKLADIAYEQILEKIYSQELPGGEKIVEQQLIEILGIGRTPVREAIQRLASDGLIDLNPGTFSRVHIFTDKEKQDLGLVRLAIDTMAAPLVVLNGSNRDFIHLMEITTECQRAYDNKNIMERLRLDFEFHTELVALSENLELTNIQKLLVKKGRLMQIQSYSEKGASFCDLTGHLDILNALHARDTSKCIEAMQNHLKHAYRSTPEEAREWSEVESALNHVYNSKNQA